MGRSVCTSRVRTSDDTGVTGVKWLGRPTMASAMTTPDKTSAGIRAQLSMAEASQAHSRTISAPTP